MHSAYLAAPSAAPSRRLSQPSETASIARVSSEATSRNSRGVVRHLREYLVGHGGIQRLGGQQSHNQAQQPRQLAEKAFREAQHGARADEDQEDDVEGGHINTVSKFQSAKIHCFA